jgi:rhamnosyltransferase
MWMLDNQSDQIPEVAVLLATKNGINWIAEQVESILAQSEVSVRLIVSDDDSTDGTWEWLSKAALKDSRIILLPSGQTFGSAGKNFYRLITAIDADDFDFVALADQDDIWLKSKLRKQISLAIQYDVDGVSSNVVAFWPDSRLALVDKAEPMRRLDFLFESAGPGCTFVLSPRLVAQVQKVLSAPESMARDVELHDWLIYAVCRSAGGSWYINPIPGMRYRQHRSNVIGVNFGLKALLTRFRWVINGWYRSEVVKLSYVSANLTSDLYVKNACHTIQENGFLGFSMLRFMSQTRRNLSDRLILTAFLLLGFF